MKLPVSSAVALSKTWSIPEIDSGAFNGAEEPPLKEFFFSPCSHRITESLTNIGLLYLHVGCNPSRVNCQDGEFLSLEIFRKLLNVHVDSGLGDVIRSNGAGVVGKTDGSENRADGEDLSLALLLQQRHEALSDKYSADDIGVEYVEQCLRRAVGKNTISIACNEGQLFALLTDDEAELYKTYVVKEVCERSVLTPALLMRTYTRVSSI